MTTIDRTRTNRRSRLGTGLAGVAATTAVAALLTAVVTAPASSTPGTYLPTDPGRSASAGAARVVSSGPYCFMGGHRLITELVGEPPCRRRHASP
jgi:hypothetical protein